ncbi:MAG: hypothetical protein ACRCTI_02920, partial [Beijerinckiaceae bacterium]
MTSALRNARIPLAALTAMAATVVVLLAMPVRLPLGPNYWDLYTYVDTAHRMTSGQVPHVDFFLPVGVLSHALYAWVSKLFPQAHTLLAVHFGILVVALPAMAIIAVEAARRSAAAALWLTIPFVVFGLTPINGVELYPSPGFDGYGNYHRHGALLLYLLAATLLFVENRTRSTALAIVLL